LAGSCPLRCRPVEITCIKRVFDIDIETCSERGGDVYIIASIEDPMVIRKILAHFDGRALPAATASFSSFSHPFLILTDDSIIRDIDRTVGVKK
jgi:hypothetical protein